MEVSAAAREPSLVGVTMIVNYDDRTMSFNHEQDMMVVLRFMFGNDVCLGPLRENDQDAYRSIYRPGHQPEATVYFDAGEEF